MRKKVKVYLKSGQVVKFKAKSVIANIDPVTNLLQTLSWDGSNKIVSFAGPVDAVVID